MEPRGTLEERIWSADFGRYGGRRARGSFSYRAYIPDPIAEFDVVLPGDVAEVVSEAEREVALLNQSPPKLGGLETLARQLLRAESLASSRIEGLTLSHRRLAKAAVDPQDSSDINARSALGNIIAMEKAIEIGADVPELRPEDIVTIHKTLFRGTRDEAIAGVIRTTQNWIGGNSDTPRNADFIPPPPGEVSRLLEDLCEFMNRDDLPAVAQAAIAHAQFETIHPFPDGNGRVGRCLIHAILRRRNLAPRYVPPISLVLATDVRGYEQGLTDYRDGKDAEWCAVFAQATRTAAREAEGFALQIGALQEEWLERAGNPRRDSAARKLIATLPAHPIVDVAAAMKIAGVSDVAAGRAIDKLEQAGVLQPERRGQRRGRSWEARELFNLVNGFERHLATAPGERRPARPAPDRARS
jgi:Fic family protein